MVWGFESDCWSTWRGKKYLVLQRRSWSVLTSATSRDATEIGSGLPSLRCLSASTGSDGCYQTPAGDLSWPGTLSCGFSPRAAGACVRQRTSHCGWPASGRCPSCRAEDDSTTESARRKGWRLWGLCKGGSPLALRWCIRLASAPAAADGKKTACACLSHRLRWTLCWVLVTASLSSSLKLRIKQLCSM